MDAQSRERLLPRRLGDFVVVREIGRGGMGVVYEAQQESLNRRVALKVLSSTIGLPARAVQRFQREAEAAASLHHTNIVPVYATGEHDGARFYAMELVEGPSLDRLVSDLRRAQSADSAGPQFATTGAYVGESTPPPSGSGSGLGTPNSSPGFAYFDAVAEAIAGVADALDYAHRQGVIHRDIKPSNLLLSSAGRLSVTDFGLARMLEQPGMTITGEMVGTPMYMSPEQITAGRVPVDHRTDIYSLGATLYEMLTLAPPYCGEQRQQLLAQVIQKEPRPPRKLNPKVPVDLETICLKAMDKDPDRRYQTAGQMADDLRRYINRFAILARRTGPLGRIRKWARRNPALSFALAGVLASAALAGAFAYESQLTKRQRAAEQARYAAEMLDAERQNALERAILLARLEDFNGARQAILEAERLGCSPGQVRMLQGQLLLCEGHTREALEQLKQATELIPESVAAWSMLSVGFNQLGLAADSNRALAEATRLPSTTTEDYLFRGLAEVYLDPELGLATLDDAVRRRPSALAHMLYCEAVRMQLLAFPDATRAQRAMDDMRVLKRQLAENAMVVTTSILLHLSCWHVFDTLDLPEQRQIALDEGMSDAKVLERFPDSERAVWARWVFLDMTGHQDTGISLLRRLAERTTSNVAHMCYGQHCYRSGDYNQAAKVMEQLPDEPAQQFYRMMAVAELPDGLDRTNALYQQIADRNLTDWNLFNSQLMLRFLGRKAEAVEVSRKALLDETKFPPLRQEQFRRALEYCAELRSADDLLAAVAGHRGDLCNAHLCIALTALADGDRARARKHLELAASTRFYEWFPFDVSRMLLARMDKDSAWPPWIEARP